MKGRYWKQDGVDFYIYDDLSFEPVEKVTFREDAELGIDVKYYEPGLSDVAKTWFIHTWCPANNIWLLN